MSVTNPLTISAVRNGLRAFVAPSSSDGHLTHPLHVHDDQVLRAQRIRDDLFVRGILVRHRSDVLRAAAELGLLVVTPADAERRVRATRSPSGHAARVQIAFSPTLAQRAARLGVGSIASTIRGAIDRGLTAFEALS